MSDRFMKYDEVNGLNGNITLSAENNVYEKVFNDEYEYIKINMLRSFASTGLAKLKLYINEAKEDEAILLDSLISSYKFEEIGIRKIRLVLDTTDDINATQEVSIILMR